MEVDAVLGTEGGVEEAGLAGVEEVVDVHVEVEPVVGGVLVAGPVVVHDDRFERADLDADVAAHAARVVDPELLDDLAAVAGALGVLRVVVHHSGHAVDRAVADADVAARAGRLVVRQSPR